MNNEQAFKFIQQVCNDLLQKIDEGSAKVATQLMMEQALNSLHKLLPQQQITEDQE